MKYTFTGLFTALITPFDSNGKISEKELFALIDKQIEGNVDGIVILGTTGESPTINSNEQKYLIDRSIKYINKRCKVIIGTGSNSTSTTINNSLFAEAAGADGLLVVNPYYNKPTQKGLLEHFKVVAQSVKTPIILYNIEGRTGVNLETPTLVKLSEIPNIVAVKEASGNITQIKEVIAAVPDGFSVLSGDDAITLDLIKSGGHGLVSVMSNILPDRMKNFVDLCNNRDWENASKTKNNLDPLFDVAFVETNPQPLKTMMAASGLCQEIFRLPLTTMDSKNKDVVLNAWERWKANNI